MFCKTHKLEFCGVQSFASDTRALIGNFQKLQSFFDGKCNSEVQGGRVLDVQGFNFRVFRACNIEAEIVANTFA